MITFQSDTYNIACKALINRARVDVLACAANVRRQLALHLAREPQGERLARLALSDIAETLLVKETEEIIRSPLLEELDRTLDRSQVIELLLTGWLVEWLFQKAQTTDEQAALIRIEPRLVAGAAAPGLKG